MAESTKQRSDEGEMASSWVESRQQQEKSPFTVVKLFIALVALLFVLGIASFMVPAIQASREERAALERARAIPPVEREKIVRACAEIARQIDPNKYERIFGENPENPPIPPEFAALQAMRVNVSENEAHIKLQYSFDSGVMIRVEGLDGTAPTATLNWGERGENEAWSGPSSVTR